MCNLSVGIMRRSLKDKGKVFLLIWCATIWLIWKERNARIFTNKEKEVEEVVDEIKAVSWVWTLSRLKIASFLFYEWTWNPRVPK